MASTVLTRAQYAGLDFDTIEDELRSRLQVKFASSFNDFAVSSLGIVLLDVVAYGLDTLAFYLDRRATDTYLQTARTRRAVALLTRQLGYKMAGAVACVVDVAIAPKALQSFPLPIPKGFQLQGPSNIIFEVAQDVTIPANTLDAVTVPCYQGRTVSETFTSDGTANQVFRLSRVPTDHAIAQGTVQVLVNGDPYTESDFITFDATNQFEVGYNDDPPTLRFGDGAAGNIPPQASTITVVYVATLGEDGKALSGSIKTVVNPLVVMFQTIELAINNPANTDGGSNLEDLIHAKTYAPRVFKSRRIAVTRSDYEALAGSYVDPIFGRVAVAQAISARSASQDTELLTQTVAIRSNISATDSAITGALSTPTTGAFSVADSISANVTALQANLTSLLAKLNSIATNVTTLLSNTRTIKNNASEIQTDYADAHTSILTAKANITTLRNTVLAMTVAGSTQLTSADQSTIVSSLDGFSNSFTQVDSLLLLINSLAATIGSTADTDTTINSSNQALLSSDIGLDTVTTGTLTKSINDLLASSVVLIGTNVGPYSGLYLQLQTILSSIGVTSTAITSATFAIEDHMDEVLAADCQANLVSVPILARDASGFYTAPSRGLIRSLQTFLDGVKEVTHAVKVTSGATFLIPAAIRIRLGLRIGVSEAVLAATARTVVDGILRDRIFGASLYVSDLLDPLKSLGGVVFVNVDIQGYRPLGGASVLTDKTDADGNLIITDSEVISLSLPDLSVTTEVVTGTQ